MQSSNTLPPEATLSAELYKNLLNILAISQAELGRRLGVNKSRINHLVSGKNAQPISKFIEIAQKLGVQVDVSIKSKADIAKGTQNLSFNIKLHL